LQNLIDTETDTHADKTEYMTTWLAADDYSDSGCTHPIKQLMRW